MDGDTDRQTHRLTVTQIYRKRDRQADKGTEREMDLETDRTLEHSQ